MEIQEVQPTALPAQIISLTLEQRLERYNSLPVSGFADVVRCKSKGLKKIADTYGIKELQLFLVDVIAELAQFVNVGKNMNSAQCFQTAELLISKYPGLHLEDIKLCIHNMKSGDYGKFYDRLDGQVILDCFDKYTVQKMEFIENEHYTIKHTQPEIFSAENDQFIAILKNLTTPIKKAAHIERTPTRIDTLSNEWMREFDVMYREQLKGMDGGLKTVTVNGKKMDVIGYLNHRLEQYHNDNNAA